MRKTVRSLIAVAIATAGWIGASAGPATGSASAPSPPRSVRPSPGNGQATLVWVAPTDKGGSPITEYEVYPYINNAVQQVRVFHSTRTTEVIVALKNGRPYTFKVAAHNASGWSKLSARSPEIMIGVPGAPYDVRAVAGDGRATVSWSRPPANGSALASYRITPILAGRALAARTFDAAATKRVVTGLANGKSYTFEVQARNARGWSPPSPETPPVVVGAPAAPSHVSAVAGHSQATVSWTSPASANGAAIDAYRVRPFRSRKAQPPVIFGGPATTRKISGLTSGKSYSFAVEAHNARGWSPVSPRSPAVKPT